MGTRKEKSPVGTLRTDESHRKHLQRIKARNKRITLLAVSACLCLTLLACVGTGLYLLLREPEDDGRIIANVTVGGVNIGGMTPAEATNALQVSIAQPIASIDLVVELPGATLTLAPANTKAQLDLETLVRDAYALGRNGSNLEKNLSRASGHVIPLLSYLDLDLDYIRKAVEDFATGYSIYITQPSVTLEGERPVYVPPTEEDEEAEDGTGEEPEEPAPPQEPVPVVHQVLTVTMGTPQFILDAQDLYDAVLDAYSLFNMSISYQAPDRIEPDPLDLQAIFDAYCIYPQDAVLDPDTFVITPEIVGYGFDIETLQALIDEAYYGDKVQITLDFLMPDITTKSFGEMFQDVLGTYVSTTTDAPNANRDANVLLSCQAINGYVIKPGEVFDFNRILGPRTTDKGYHNAPNYSGSTTSSVGGGITQTASVLHYCALLAGLQIDEHHYHRYSVPYTLIGTDASINYGSENLVFTNNTDFPIRILATYQEGQLTVTMLGTEVRDYVPSLEIDVLETVEPGTVYQYMTKDNVFGYEDGQILESAITGYTVELFLIHRDPETGEEILRQSLATVSYDKRDQQVVRIEDTQITE